MRRRKPSSKTQRKSKRGAEGAASRIGKHSPELVIITGMSGSGKASVLKAFEDLGYYCVDNLPVQLIPQFAELAVQSSEIRRTALVVDVREGSKLEKLPDILKAVRRMIPTKVVFLEASDAVLLRRFSETRRPHPLGNDSPVKSALKAERRHLGAIRALADFVIDTSKFNVHELRSHINERFQEKSAETSILVSCVSFGFRQGVPEDADLVFDVRFLPNPHFVPEFRPLTGRDPRVLLVGDPEGPRAGQLALSRPVRRRRSARAGQPAARRGYRQRGGRRAAVSFRNASSHHLENIQ